MIPIGLRNRARHFEAGACDFEPALDWLIGIGDAAHHECLRFPTRRRKFVLEKLGGVFLHHNAALEIDSGGEAEIFVRRSRVAINATVLAAAIRIDARLEADIRTVVVGDDCPGEITQINRAAGRPIRIVLIFRIGLEVESLEAVGRIVGCAASVNRLGQGMCFGRIRHGTRSTERIPCPAERAAYSRNICPPRLRRWRSWARFIRAGSSRASKPLTCSITSKPTSETL